MAGSLMQICHTCGSGLGFSKDDTGFYYCDYCGSRAEGLIESGLDENELFNRYSASCNRVRTVNPTAAEPISEVKLTTSQHLDHPNISTAGMEVVVGDGVGPTEPSDFGSSQKNFSYDEYYSEIRSRYLTGLQVMVQLQCQALVEKFNVSPVIIGLVGPLWLRFVASTRITADEWADQAVHDSEAHTQGEEEFNAVSTYGPEPVNIHGKRVVYVWYKSLRRTIPVSCSLAISFLACHVAREAITPSDMLNWTLEGKLPYFAAFVEIEKQIGSHSETCPIRVSRMFRPIKPISSQKLESMAADVAQKICLQLPPVNFYAIASRYFRQLSLPIGKFLPLACRICEWSTPPELYLSASDLRIPTRACVMSILIVTIRVLYGINGYGIWESSLSNPYCSSSRDKNEDTESLSHVNTNVDEDLSSTNFEPSYSKSDVLDSKLNVMELLHILEAKYSELDYMHEYSNDLLSYLQYCKDVVFSGLQSSNEGPLEKELLEEFWDFYQNNKAAKTSDNQSTCSTSQCSDRDQDSACENRPSKECPKDKAIKQLKLDMEDNKFCYIPPRTKVKRKDYLHYARRREDVYIYAVHADYYILLRSCAKVAQVETRIMHIAVLTLERRLQWLEKRADSSLQMKLNLNDACGFCNNDSVQDIGDDPMDLSL
ncbi:hypothetical protein ABFX02_06G201824 [Erythranthe guttata]